MITISIEAQSIRGPVRENNEDMILVSTRTVRDSSLVTKVLLDNKDRYIVAVADGMGGHQSGEVASEIVTSDMSSFFNALPDSLSYNELREYFQIWIEEEHTKLKVRGEENALLKGMGTTMVCLVIYENKVIWLNCGDSRIYRFRNGFLTQLSTDHSLEEMTGIKGHPNVICNSIGAGNSSFFDLEDITAFVFNNDTFLLCSDGLSNMLSDDKMESILKDRNSVEELIDMACKAGGMDNISICLAHFEMK